MLECLSVCLSVDITVVLLLIDIVVTTRSRSKPHVSHALFQLMKATVRNAIFCTLFDVTKAELPGLVLALLKTRWQDVCTHV